MQWVEFLFVLLHFQQRIHPKDLLSLLKTIKNINSFIMVIRQIIISKNLERKLGILAELNEEVSGIHLYKQECGNCVLEGFFLLEPVQSRIC